MRVPPPRWRQQVPLPRRCGATRPSTTWRRRRAPSCRTRRRSTRCSATSTASTSPTSRCRRRGPVRPSVRLSVCLPPPPPGERGHRGGDVGGGQDGGWLWGREGGLGFATPPRRKVMGGLWDAFGLWVCHGAGRCWGAGDAVGLWVCHGAGGCCGAGPPHGSREPHSPA